jgi:hypothetical protein
VYKFIAGTPAANEMFLAGLLGLTFTLATFIYSMMFKDRFELNSFNEIKAQYRQVTMSKTTIQPAQASVMMEEVVKVNVEPKTKSARSDS